MLIPFSRGDLVSFICDNSEVYSLDYKENGTFIEAEIKEKDYGKVKEYEVV